MLPQNFRCALLLIAIFGLVTACTQVEKKGSELFKYSDDKKPRWSSPENMNGLSGNAGKENNRAKGHAFDPIAAGASQELMNVAGQGIVNRIWITVADRSPEMLRSLKLEIFWDKSATPAVAAPLGDFFGVGLGLTSAFDNALFANAEGRSFQCFIPMPYKTGARIVITNESTKDLSHIFWDIDFQETKTWDNDNLYFHTVWNRDTATTLAQDFELLPALKGKGGFWVSTWASTRTLFTKQPGGEKEKSKSTSTAIRNFQHLPARAPKTISAQVGARAATSTTMPVAS
jgi:Protein of unknown function (DUF2961)